MYFIFVKNDVIAGELPGTCLTDLDFKKRPIIGQIYGPIKSLSECLSVSLKIGADKKRDLFLVIQGEVEILNLPEMKSPKEEADSLSFMTTCLKCGGGLTTVKLAENRYQYNCPDCDTLCPTCGEKATEMPADSAGNITYWCYRCEKLV